MKEIKSSPLSKCVTLLPVKVCVREKKNCAFLCGSDYLTLNLSHHHIACKLNRTPKLFNVAGFHTEN